MKMGSTWRASKPGLKAEEWEAAGYSPRRRSITYLLGECLLKGNQEGPYRTRYNAVRNAKEGVEGWKDLRAHRHGMLLATKLALKNLWIAWNGEDAGGAESTFAATQPIQKGGAK